MDGADAFAPVANSRLLPRNDPSEKRLKNKGQPRRQQEQQQEREEERQQEEEEEVAREAPAMSDAAKALERAQLAAAISAFNARMADSTVETWPMADLVKLRLRSAFLEPPFPAASSANTPKSSWEVNGRLVGTPLSATAFELFRTHVNAWLGCDARRVKLSQALKKKVGREHAPEDIYYTEVVVRMAPTLYIKPPALWPARFFQLYK